MASAEKRFLRFNKRQVVVGLGLMLILTLSLLTVSRPTLLGGNSCGRTIRTLNEAVAFSKPSGGEQYHMKGERQDPVYVDLNQLEATATAKDNQEHVLILTPLKNAANYLPRYFELIDRMSYPKHLISIAFLVSDTTDNTVELLEQQANIFLSRWRNRYHSITIYQKDFRFELPEDQRHKFELQPLRRSFMARARNYLLTAALKDEHAWVLWLDVDLVEYPATILEDLQSVDVDVVVPNCLRETEDGSFWGYDKNNWQETDRSLELQKDLDPVCLTQCHGCVSLYDDLPLVSVAALFAPPSFATGICLTRR